MHLVWFGNVDSQSGADLYFDGDEVGDKRKGAGFIIRVYNTDNKSGTFSLRPL
jgi:hypothetical protein